MPKLNLPTKKEATRNKYKKERDQQLLSSTVLVGGMEFQARPSDITNIQTGIAVGQTEWVLADNSIGTVTTAQLEEVLSKGISKGASIWNEYIEKLKTI